MINTKQFVAAVSSLVLATSLVACGKSDKADGGGGGGAKPVEAKLEFKKLGDLGLEAELPADAKVDDNSKSVGYASATIWASPTTFIDGAGEMSDLKESMEDTKAKMIKDEKSLTPGREEKTADGWIIEMTGKSITGSEMTAVHVRRTIDGKPFDCHSNVRGKDEAAKLVKLCQSIRKG